MHKKDTVDKDPKVHKNLEGFRLEINEFGEIISSFQIEKLNDFLNSKVDDKKLRDREDLEFIRRRKKSDRQK